MGQKELAGRAGVSQSLIAKVEAGKMEPSYTKARKLFEALEELGRKEETKAKELMNKKIIFAWREESIKEAIKIMKQKGISQMPVGEEGKVYGLVSEKTILEEIMKGKKIERTKVREVMEDCPPIISPETSRKIVLEILKEHPIVLVAEKGEVKGLISKSDVLGKI